MTNKKTILFIVDQPNWAFDFMVSTWIQLIYNQYDCYIAYSKDFLITQNNNKSNFYRFIFNTIKEVQWSFYRLLNKDKSVNFISTNHNYFYKKYVYPPIYLVNGKTLEKSKSNITTFNYQIEMDYFFQYVSEFPTQAEKKIIGIFTDSYPHDGPNYDFKNNVDVGKLSRVQFYNQYLKFYDWLMVGGGKLLQSYQTITNRVSFVYGIFGQEKFVENNNVGKNTKLVLGWTGNPNRSMKGFREIIEPTITKLQNKGFDIELKTKFSGPYHELYSFYKDVDVLLIASNADSGPSSFAEASLCNVPTISTKVGLPLFILKDNENGIFVERDEESLANAIIRLYNDRELLSLFSKKIKNDYLDFMDNKKTTQYFLNILNNDCR